MTWNYELSDDQRKDMLVRGSFLSVDEGWFVVSGVFQIHRQVSSLHRALRLSFQNIRLADREEASNDDAMPILRAGKVW